MFAARLPRVIGSLVLSAMLILPAGPALADSDGITVVNDTSNLFLGIRLSYPGDEDWGPDLLGADTIDPGGSLYVGLDLGGDCRFDAEIGMITKSGLLAIARQTAVDLCGSSTLQASDFD